MKNKLTQVRKSIQTRAPRILTILLVFFVIVVVIVLTSDREMESSEEEKEVVAKRVEILELGVDAIYKTHGTVVNSSRKNISAQAGGIVSNVVVSTGETVKKGQPLLQIGNTYSGANSSAIQLKIAQSSYQSAKDTFLPQLDVINIQREIARASKENANESRKIATNSIDGTQSLIDQNDKVVHQLEENIQILKDTNTEGANDEAILSLQQAINATRGGILQLRSQLDSSRLQIDDSASAELIEYQNQLALTQLDLQEKALYTSLDIAELQVSLARISYELTSPVSPIDGVVEHVFIKENDSVNPGMPLVVIKGEESAEVVVNLPSQLYPFINQEDIFILHSQNKTFEVNAQYVSTVPISGKNHSVTFILEDASVFENDRLVVEIPLISSFTSSKLIPLDALHITQDQNILYVQNGDRAEAREVETGTIIGGFIEVVDGLDQDENIILTRNVVDGDTVVTE